LEKQKMQSEDLITSPVRSFVREMREELEQKIEKWRQEKLANAQNEKESLLKEFKHLFPQFGSRVQPDLVGMGVARVGIPGKGRQL
jgi:hypothetical protein